MRKTNIKTTIFLAFGLWAGLFSAFSAYASEITTEKVVLLANQERQKAGLPDLALNPVLVKIAQNKAKDMLENDYFAHTSPNGKTPWYWFEKEGYDYGFAGENLAINFTSVEKQNDSWMKSETHRKNILSTNFNEIGVAVARGKVGGKEVTVTVQEFGSPLHGGAVAGEEVAKDSQRVSIGYEESGPYFQDIENAEGFLAGLSLNIRSAANLRIMKGIMVVSAALAFVLFFSFFAHRISRIGDALERMGRKLFQEDFDFREIHGEKHKIAVRFFPVDMVKIRVNHLHHMKQRE